MTHLGQIKYIHNVTNHDIENGFHLKPREKLEVNYKPPARWAPTTCSAWTRTCRGYNPSYPCVYKAMYSGPNNSLHLQRSARWVTTSLGTPPSCQGLGPRMPRKVKQLSPENGWKGRQGRLSFWGLGATFRGELWKTSGGVSFKHHLQQYGTPQIGWGC